MRRTPESPLRERKRAHGCDGAGAPALEALVARPRELLLAPVEAMESLRKATS